MLVIVVILHILDRQIEYTSRTDYLWKTKLKVEQEEVETMRGINKVVIKIELNIFCILLFLQLFSLNTHFKYTCIFKKISRFSFVKIQKYIRMKKRGRKF